MGKRFEIARVLVTIPAAFLLLGPPLADLNETHVFNPLWSGHARLHTVWLITSNSILGLIAIWILWQRSTRPLRSSVFLAGSLMAAILAGFFVAAATQSFYGGSLTDPNGISFEVGSLDANLAAFSFLFLLLAAAFWLAARPDTGAPERSS